MEKPYFGTLTCSWETGVIHQQIKEAIKLAIKTGSIIKFEFNGIWITVNHLSNEGTIYDNYIKMLEEKRRQVS